MKELEDSTAQMGKAIHETTRAWAFHKAGLYDKVTKPYEITFGVCQKTCC